MSEENRAQIEQDFWLHRFIHKSSVWVGRSADAMLTSAITGEPAKEWPFDGWDLGRCLLTREVAPEHLHEAMDRYIAEARDHVDGAFYGFIAAEEMVEGHLEAVWAALDAPLFIDGMPNWIRPSGRQWEPSERAYREAEARGEKAVSREVHKSRSEAEAARKQTQTRSVPREEAAR